MDVLHDTKLLAPANKNATIPILGLWRKIPGRPLPYQGLILLEPTPIVVTDAARQFLEAATTMVERNLSSAQFSVLALVLIKEIVISQSVFYRHIRSITGQTAVEFVRDVRLKRVAQRLIQTQIVVSEVTFEVEFEDPKCFRKAFLKTYHVSPSKYTQ